ncbi:hypothetical protein CcaverHIS631_0607160 [Cutaneotrichosporon cavernicola]|nr:hypothetical protein CcaverHIS631_0607160 [Cutaneotrichosporon cavernicola]BEJ09795.1 hypothetical protein CcaverHIS641_0607100 [Cutaneotrichosporon cavernicola]
MASSPPPPPRRTLRLTLPADALSPSLTFSPPLSWNFDGAWNLVNATGASISHTFAGERWALRGSANALVIAGPSADLTVDGIPTKSINTVGDEVVAAKVGEGWHTAKYSLSGYRGELSVYGATSELSIVADLSEDEFKALEQRVPLSEHGDNLVYDGWSAVEAAQGTMGTLVLNIPSNTSLFALSGTRGPAGTVQLTLTPPILDRGDFAADTALAAPSNDTALFTAPLDPQIQYAVNITGRGARLSALHYWPVSSDAFPWRRSSWSPPSSLLYIPPPPPSNPQSSLAQHRRKNIGAIVGGTIGGLVILSVLIIMALCECRRVRFFGARYRPRRGVSKRGISSSDLTRFDEHYFSHTDLEFSIEFTVPRILGPILPGPPRFIPQRLGKSHFPNSQI